MARSDRTVMATRLAGVSRRVFKGEVVRLERVAAHLDGRGEEGPPCALRILRGRDHDFARVCSFAKQRGSWAVLGDEDAPVTDSGGDFYVEPACWAGLGRVIEGHLYRGEVGVVGGVGEVRLGDTRAVCRRETASLLGQEAVAALWKEIF
jgi:hypothetical protein